MSAADDLSPRDDLAFALADIAGRALLLAEGLRQAGALSEGDRRVVLGGLRLAHAGVAQVGAVIERLAESFDPQDLGRRRGDKDTERGYNSQPSGDDS